MAGGQSLRGTKFTLIAGFIFAVLAVITAGYFVYSSFTNLLDAVETLSTPDKSQDILQDIITTAIESESSMRTYTITEDTNALDAYLEQMSRIDSNLNALKLLPSYQAIDKKEVDSLNELFTNKADLMYTLVELKNSSDDYASDIAFNQITSTIRTQEDTETEKAAIADTISLPGLKQSSLAQQQEASKKKQSEKKRQGILKNWRRKKNIATEPEISTVISIKDTSKTTSAGDAINYDVSPNSQVDISEIRDILYDINQDEKKYDIQYTNRELEILTSDKVTIQKIRKIIENIQQYELERASSQVQHAQLAAKSSSKIILLISLGSLLAGIIFLGIIITDINRSNRYKNALEYARQKAELLAKAKEEFLANMSHEIRTPLNAIIGFSEQLYSTPLQMVQKDYLNAVQSASSHLLNTVNDILDLSKIEAGKLQFENKPFKIHDVVEEVATIMKIKSDEKKLILKYDFDEGYTDYVVGDAFRLKQILYNLCGNAIKFTDTGTIDIVCSSKVADRSIQYIIQVKDTGIGIPTEKLDAIFESFSQADSGTTRKFGGTGLGLSISKQLVELQNGTISAQNNSPRGAIFKLQLTYKIATQKQIDAISTYTDHTINSLKNYSILVVDDEPYNLMLAEIILKKTGADTTCVSSSQSALDYLGKKNFDIILADLHMPEYDGVMLAKKIRETNKQTPLIALTANVMQNEQKALTKVGFNDIILKPYKESELLSKIVFHLNMADKELVPHEEKLIDPPTDSTIRLFDLKEIKQFTENDVPATISIIKTFIDNNKINIQNLAAHIQAKNTEGMNNTAHKMLPSFTHFKITNVVAILKEMEIEQCELLPDVYSKLNFLLTTCDEIFNALENEIKTLSVLIDI